ncbi:extensin-like domain-containing protein [Paracoccus sediminicola]|uniref:extensin-like domain-containing protein n=1 Tax=Paracoccus sediminicola TaxID=3017783 RepID=UPI0022F13504|nr:extensin family protein [Paracoccus sediminicola]WBU56929.1 extensin family protein [Paracoccus sediminicola]
MPRRAALLLAVLTALPVAAQDRPGDASREAGPEAAPLTESLRPEARPPMPAAPDTSKDITDPLPEPPADNRPDRSQPQPLPDGPQIAAPPAWQRLAEDEFGFQSCLLGLSMMGVAYETAAPVSSAEDRDCGIARPIRVREIQPGLALSGAPLMRCATARQLARWVRQEAQPAARLLPGAPRITALLPGSTYQCRERVGGTSDRISEHALGNAFDIAGLQFSDGTEMMIAPRNETGGIEEAFQKAIRHGGCLFFTTVLGPGSNAAHDDHLHFDIIARRGGWRLCE